MEESEGVSLRPGTEVLFDLEHVSDIDRPPRHDVLERYGSDFVG